MAASSPALHLLPRAGLPLEATPVVACGMARRPSSFLSPKPTPESSNLSLLLTASLLYGQKGGQLERMAAEFLDCKPGCRKIELPSICGPQATWHPEGMAHRALLWAGGCPEPLWTSCPSC